jgi:rhodanese-related sulfurtransferase
MKRRPSIPSLLLSIVFSLVFAVSGTTAKGVSARTTSNSPGHSVKVLKKPNPTLSISVDALLNKLRQSQPVTLVDIRSPSDFDTAGIPGSINIPLYTIKTKAFLKSVPFVLIEDGYRFKYLERQCEALRAEGFAASFLTGGLNAWKHRGGLLRESAFQRKTFNRISPQAFYQAKNDEGWIFINASKEQTSASIELFPRAFHINIIGHAEPTLLAVKRKAEPGKSDFFGPLLIFNEDGNQYEKIEKIIEGVGFLNAFYLKGGLRAYEAFVNHLALARKPRDERLKSSRECGACRKGKSLESEEQGK